MSQLTDDQIDSLANAAAFINNSEHMVTGLITLVGEADSKDVISSVFMDRKVERFNLSVIYTFIDSLVDIAGKAESCDCDACQKYRAKIDLIRQIINPN